MNCFLIELFYWLPVALQARGRLFPISLLLQNWKSICAGHIGMHSIGTWYQEIPVSFHS